MQNLSYKIERLKDTSVGDIVEDRVEEFKEIGCKGNNRWFSELSFCILTANSTAQLGIDIQNDLGAEGFIELPFEDLKEKIKNHGHRFYRTRSEYILEARRYSDDIKNIITDFSDSKEARKWLVDNVKGIGYKEGSHFLRNVGYDDLAILDRHVLRVLDEGELIDCIPKTLTKKRYLAIEKDLEGVIEEVGLSLAQTDLYIWYMDTGKILK